MNKMNALDYFRNPQMKIMADTVINQPTGVPVYSFAVTEDEREFFPDLKEFVTLVDDGISGPALIMHETTDDHYNYLSTLVDNATRTALLF